MDIRPFNTLLRLKVNSKQTEQTTTTGKEQKTPAPTESKPTADRVAPLQNAIANSSEAGRAINQLADPKTAKIEKPKPRQTKEFRDVEASNQEASLSTVRDVESASELAQDLASRIVRFGTAAITAQANQDADTVDNLTER